MPKKLTLKEARETARKAIDKQKGAKPLSKNDLDFRENFYGWCQEVVLDPAFGEVMIRKLVMGEVIGIGENKNLILK